MMCFDSVPFCQTNIIKSLFWSKVCEPLLNTERGHPRNFQEREEVSGIRMPSISFLVLVLAHRPLRGQAPNVIIWMNQQERLTKLQGDKIGLDYDCNRKHIVMPSSDTGALNQRQLYLCTDGK